MRTDSIYLSWSPQLLWGKLFEALKRGCLKSRAVRCQENCQITGYVNIWVTGSDMCQHFSMDLGLILLVCDLGLPKGNAGASSQPGGGKKVVKKRRNLGK